MEHDTNTTSTSKVENHDEGQTSTRLAEELKETQSKFEAWKAKAKIGVDQLRGRIVELTAQLEASESQRQSLAISLEQLSSSREGKVISAEGLELNHSLAVPTLKRESAVDEAISNDCAEKTEILREALLHQKKALPQYAIKGNANSTSESELELYKRRVATTMKLQQKNSEALQNQVVELQQRLQLAEKELHERASALAGKEETVSLLEQRLSSVERAYEELRQKQGAPLCGPDMDGISAMEEKMEEVVNKMRAEFALHENVLLMQHYEELKRVQSVHEREIQALHQQAEEKLAREVEAALSFQRNQGTLTPHTFSTQDDAAYMELLKEFEALEAHHRTLTKENADMKNRIQKLTSRKEAERTDDGKLDHVSCYQHNPTSFAEAKEMIRSLQTSLTATTDQLWQAKKTLMSTKEKKLPQGTLDPQHVTYLKSIIVNMFCKCNNNPTIAKLLPVVSTLLHFSEEDLESIYEGNPEWKRKG